MMLEIGQSAPRADARAKVTGAERYAIDHYPPKLLWAGAKRAGVPHARLRGVDVQAAQALPGVVAVLAISAQTPRKGKTSPAPCFVRCVTSYRKRKSGHGRVRNGTVSVMRRWGCTKVS